MKILLSAALALSVMFSPAVVHAQVAPVVQPAPTKVKTVDIPTPQQIEIIKLQRDTTSAYAREQDRLKQAQDRERQLEEKAQKEINDLSTKLGNAIAKVKNDLKLPAEAIFNADAVSFTVPEKK